jgi:Ca2+-binding EF-hand superfamily protein
VTWQSLDVDHDGYLTLSELRQSQLLPGVKDRAVSAMIVKLLQRASVVLGLRLPAISPRI